MEGERLPRGQPTQRKPRRLRDISHLYLSGRAPDRVLAAPRRSLRVGFVAHGDRAVITVHNEGPHIPPAKQDLLFRPFVRVVEKESRKKRGWGLGPTMVRGMAEGHGGSVSVDSAPDRGTTFRLELPLDARPFVAKAA